MKFSTLSRTLFFSSIDFSAASSSTPNVEIECIASPILAPQHDCSIVIDHLYAQYSGPGNDKLRTWGRSVTPSTPPDDSKVQLPYGFRLTRLFPWMEPNRCEIHVDNAIDRLDGQDNFTSMELVAAGRYLLEICYPRMLTGKAFPTLKGNVYVTTLYVGGEAAESRSNVTMLQEVQLETEFERGTENLTIF